MYSAFQKHIPQRFSLSCLMLFGIMVYSPVLLADPTQPSGVTVFVSDLDQTIAPATPSDQAAPVATSQTLTKSPGHSPLQATLKSGALPSSNTPANLGGKLPALSNTTPLTGASESIALPPALTATEATTESTTEEPRLFSADRQAARSILEHSESAESHALIQLPKKSIPIEAASFDGLKPLVATLEDAIELLGTPTQTRETAVGTSEFRFEYPPFDHVEVVCREDVIQTITIQLDAPYGLDDLISQLGLNDVRPAQLLSESGKLLGYCFPERGVLFGLESGDDQVTHILLEAITALPFLVRAEQAWEKHPGASLQDIKQALTLDSQIAEAYSLQAKIYLNHGRPQDALNTINRAIELDKQSVEYYLIQASCMLACNAPQAAQTTLNKLSAMQHLSPEYAAWLSLLNGDVLAHRGHQGMTPNFEAAFRKHSEAAAMAETLVNHPSFKTRQLAYQVAISSNLAVAQDIALGPWKSKSQAVPRWIDRAAEFADRWIQDGDAPVNLELDLLSRAAIAAVSIENSNTDSIAKAREWALAARETGEQLLAESTDVLHAGHLHWVLGATIAAEAEMAFNAQQFDQALVAAETAMQHLQQGRIGREKTTAEVQLFAQAQFRLGAVHNAYRDDHETALQLFEKVRPQLTTHDIAASPIYWPPQRHSDALVGMAISYWETGNYDRAIELTGQGLEIMQAAVAKKLAPQQALAVPYGNLAGMHQLLGNRAKAQQYRQLSLQPDSTNSTQQVSFETMPDAPVTR